MSFPVQSCKGVGGGWVGCVERCFPTLAGAGCHHPFLRRKHAALFPRRSHLGETARPPRWAALGAGFHKLVFRAVVADAVAKLWGRTGRAEASAIFHAGLSLPGRCRGR